MGQKKDIGQFFENKLNDGKKTPNKSLWDKINTSLDEEKRRKKRILFYWFVGGGLSVLLGLTILFGNGFFKNDNSSTLIENPPVVEDLNEKTKKENDEIIFQNIKKDSLVNKKEDNEKLSKLNEPSENLKHNEAVNSSEKKSQPKAKGFSSNKKPVDETFSVSEKYYYYNSRNGKQLVTENKKEIDSIVLEAYKKIDSSSHKTIDSLKQ